MAEDAAEGGGKILPIDKTEAVAENEISITDDTVLNGKESAVEVFAEMAPPEPLVAQETDHVQGGQPGSSPAAVPSLALKATHGRRKLVAQETSEYKMDVPQIFVSVTQHYLSLAPPRQLRWISECCSELLLYAMGTGDDDTPFASATREAVDQVCKGIVHSVAEEHLATAAVSSRPGSDSIGTMVLAKFLRVENVVANEVDDSNPFWRWYAVLKDQALVQVDPLRLRVVSRAKVQNPPPLQGADTGDVVTAWNRFLGEDGSAESRYLVEMRAALEKQLQHVYIPKHYPVPKGVGFSVHCSRSPELTKRFQFNISSDGVANISVMEQTPENAELNADAFVSGTEGDDCSCSTDEDGQSNGVSKASGNLSTLQIILSTEKENQCNFWSGGWSSVWDLFLTPWEQAGIQKARPVTIKMRGEIRVRLHYTEDGSTFMRHTKTATVVLPQPYNSPEAAATAVLEAIEEKELAVCEELYRFYNGLHSKILRSMRRVYPLCGQSFDWTGTFRSIAQDLTRKQQEKCYEGL